VSSLKKFNVTFRTEPHPSKVQGLAKFVAQVVSKEHGPIGLVRSKAVWKTATDKATISFSALGKVDWEEGWHFVRVLAQTESGDLIPLVDASGHAIAWSADTDETLPRPNESDLFYVLPETEVEIEPAQRAVPTRAERAARPLPRAVQGHPRQPRPGERLSSDTRRGPTRPRVTSPARTCSR
jgi:DNA phosphorothioation-dependent restriction protein DptH